MSDESGSASIIINIYDEDEERTVRLVTVSRRRSGRGRQIDTEELPTSAPDVEVVSSRRHGELP